jgi:sugar phosphate isomerase/epimerase
MSGFRTEIDDFNMFGTKTKQYGLRFFYHPHGYEFITPDGNMLDLIIEGTNPDLVTYELDVFWMIHGVADPVNYLNKYPGRFELMHLKELRHDIPGNNTGSAPDATSVSPGRGVTNWPLLLRKAAKSGVKKYYIEDEAKDAKDQVPVTINFLNSLK